MSPAELTKPDGNLELNIGKINIVFLYRFITELMVSAFLRKTSLLKKYNTIKVLLSCFPRYHAPTNSVAPCSLYKPHTTHNTLIPSDEGLTLEPSALESPYGVQIALSTQLIKPNIHFHSPATQHQSFFRH